MAQEYGTATDYQDLLAKLRTFATVTLTGDEQWTDQRYNTDIDGNGNVEWIVMGPGSSAADEIYIGIRTEYDDGEGYYNWCLNGMTGWNTSNPFWTQPGCIPLYFAEENANHCPRVLLHDNTVKYWFVGNGRRLAGVIKVATVYQWFYLGLILPYGTPTAFPYPLFVGGSSCYSSTAAYMRYSSEWARHRAFFDGDEDVNDTQRASAYFLDSDWVPVGNHDNGSDVMNCGTWPYRHGTVEYGAYNLDTQELWRNAEANLDGSVSLFPVKLWRKQPANIYGVLQGIWAVMGGDSVSEDYTTINGTQYRIAQNTFHTDTYDFAALELT